MPDRDGRGPRNRSRFSSIPQGGYSQGHCVDNIVTEIEPEVEEMEETEETEEISKNEKE